MTYGISLKNQLDDNLVDQAQGRTLYRKSSGVCRPATDVPIAGSTAFSVRRNLYPASAVNSVTRNGIVHYETKSTTSPNWLFNDKFNYATTGFRDVIFRDTTSGLSIRNKTVYVPNPISTNVDDLVFFRMPPDGIMSLAQVWIPFTGSDINGKSLINGLHAWCCPYYTYNGPALSYQVVSTDLPQRSTPMGLVVYDTDGSTVLFDTTRDIASFVDHITLTKAQAQNVILNGASYTFNLRSPVTNAWLATAGAGGMSFRSTGGSREETRCLRITQTSSTQVTVTRSIMQAPNTGGSASFLFEDYQDALFIIGDFD